MEKIYKDGELYSACFINNNNKLYIIKYHDNYPDKPDSIKILDINGKKKKGIKESKERTFFNMIKNIVINILKLFRKYWNNDYDYDYHCCIIINNNENKGIVKWYIQVMMEILYMEFSYSRINIKIRN